MKKCVLAAALTAAFGCGSAIAEDFTVPLKRGEKFATPFYNYTSDCRTVGIVKVVISGEPKHGQAGAVRGDYTIDGERCNGKKIRATFLYYVPAKGFHGTDTMTVQVSSPRDTEEYMSSTNTYDITFEVE